MIDEKEVKVFESDLDSFDRRVRENALNELSELLRTRKVKVDEAGEFHNMHCHSFYSYNGWGFSPSHLAWLARKTGMFACGLVDFDVTDGVDEFLHAACTMNLRASAGMETRVFVPEFSALEVNSPGEPGVAYHLGLGFTRTQVPEACAAFASELRSKASGRTRAVVELVNPHVGEARIDFDADAAALTPAGNVTERHVCEAYRRKAEKAFPDPVRRAGFWRGILGCDAETASGLMDNPVKLEATIRSKLMKKGGPGYMKADPASFPELRRMNEFVSACGAIPAVAWLNGLSAGEADCEALLDMHLSCGAEMLNIVPDRNWNVPDPEKSARLVRELHRIADLCRRRDIPIVAGTEMNAPGLKIVDDFDHPALAPLLADFVNGAAILSAHTLLAPLGMGFGSPWAAEEFASRAERNGFFAFFGKKAAPAEFVAKGSGRADYAADLLAEFRRGRGK